MKNNHLAARVRGIKSSATVEIASMAIQLKERGQKLIDLSVGESDLNSFEAVKSAAKNALDHNNTRYTANNGLLELREKICRKLKSENNLNYTPDSILVSSGAKHSLFNILLTLIDHGDEVLIPSPYWPSYPEIVKMAGGVPIFIETKEENGFHLQAADLEKAITEKTKLFLFCNPVNPTGAVHTKNELKNISKALLKYPLFVVTDEIYEKLIFDPIHFHSLAEFLSPISDKVIVINGMSKSYLMTGFRIGYAAGAKKIISNAAKIQSHSTSAASTISQYAAIEALNLPHGSIVHMIDVFRERRDRLYSQLAAIEGLRCVKGQGAFYLFPNISRLFGAEYHRQKILNSKDAAAFLLKEANVVVVPGAGFGADNHIRISYTKPLETLIEATENINKAICKLAILP
jgi:aspartate aminotransferase